jgi:hypothetical protein
MNELMDEAKRKNMDDVYVQMRIINDKKRLKERVQIIVEIICALCLIAYLISVALGY